MATEERCWSAAEEADVVSEEKLGEMSSWGNEIGIMKERVVCDTDGDHLPKEEMEQEKIYASYPQEGRNNVEE